MNDSLTYPFRSLLDVKLGPAQAAGNMQVIPLVEQNGHRQYAPPDRAVVETVAYGELNVHNPTQSLLIMPRDATYMVTDRAQDHALLHVGIVAPGRERLFETAACIEAAQPGYIRAGTYALGILPHPLRQRAFAVRNVHGYSKLWEAISEFNAGAGLHARGHLVDFFRSFGGQLARFVAEFEPVRHQVGALIIINGKVAGVERVPTAEYWMSVWRPLTRDCYGSLAMLQSAEAVAPFVERYSGQALSIDDLQLELKRIKRREARRAQQLAESLADLPLNLVEETNEADLLVETVESADFSGQLVRDDHGVCYASLTGLHALPLAV